MNFLTLLGPLISNVLICLCQVMLEYAANLQKFTDALEKQKQQQLEDLRRRLLDKRRQHKKDLHKQQVREMFRFYHNRLGKTFLWTPHVYNSDVSFVKGT